MANKKVVEMLTDTDRLFVLTYIAYLREELVKEQIITPAQSSQISQYLQKELRGKPAKINLKFKEKP